MCPLNTSPHDHSSTGIVLHPSVPLYKQFVCSAEQVEVPDTRHKKSTVGTRGTFIRYVGTTFLGTHGSGIVPRYL